MSHLPHTPQVAFKSTPYDDSSPGGSYDTWITTCTSVLSTEADHDHEQLHHPPTGSSPVSQAWSSPVPVPTVIETIAPLPTLRSETQDELDRMRTENTQLRREMQELKDRLRQLCTTRIPPPPSPNIDYQMLVSAFLTAIQQQPLQMQLPSPHFPQHTNTGSNTLSTQQNSGALSTLDTSMAQAPSDSILDMTTSSDKSFDHDDRK
ncbi:hypothetical protein ACA910_011284 [Epithemia clementina (nom. ined.)]